MDDYLVGKSHLDLPFYKTEYRVIDVPTAVDSFANAAAQYFVESWMSSGLPEMMQVWQNWSDASSDEKQQYRSYVEAALLHQGKLIDKPAEKYTAPLGAFTETMFRWLRQVHKEDLLLVEPPAPLPTGQGLIDMIEVSGDISDYASMRVTMWEIKGTDSDASSRNSEIYRQFRQYPTRFYAMANAMCVGYQGDSLVLKKFLRDMGRMVRNRSNQIHYGAFVGFDTSNGQSHSIVPDMHNHPPNHPKDQDGKCHQLIVLAVPDFAQSRLKVWHALHLL